jgi:hypothetical protein
MIGVLVGMAAIVLGTWFRMPTLAPIVVGVVIGWLVTNPARKAALAGALAWGGVLLVGTARGDGIGALSATLGGAMGVPAWVLPIVTLLYPAVLAASAAWLSSMIRGRLDSLRTAPNTST